MPRQDGSGPSGRGPLTGRGLGGCSPKDIEQFKNMGFFDKTVNTPTFQGYGRRNRRRGGFTGFNRNY